MHDSQLLQEKFLQSFGSGVELDSIEESEIASQNNEIDESFNAIRQDELAEVEQTSIKEDAAPNKQPTTTKEE